MYVSLVQIYLGVKYRLDQIRSIRVSTESPSESDDGNSNKLRYKIDRSVYMHITNRHIQWLWKKKIGCSAIIWYKVQAHVYDSTYLEGHNSADQVSRHRSRYTH